MARAAARPIVEAFPIPDGVDRRRAATRSTACATPRTPPGPDVRVGGQPAPNDDFIDAVYGNFPLMIALIALLTFMLLARAFRSLLLPLKAVVLNVLSVAAAWGVLVLVWQKGHGSERDLGHRGDRLDHVLDPADGLRVPVRPLDGLRGLHPRPHAGGVRRDRLDRRGGGRAASAAPGGW